MLSAPNFKEFHVIDLHGNFREMLFFKRACGEYLSAQSTKPTLLVKPIPAQCFGQQSRKSEPHLLARRFDLPMLE